MTDRQWMIAAAIVCVAAVALGALAWLPLILTSWHWWLQ